MTTSHRPTFFTAKGSDRGGGQATFQVCDDTYEHIVINLITFLILICSFFPSIHPYISVALYAQVSSKNLNSHMSLKFRQIGQNAKSEVNERDLRKELDKKEEEYVKNKNKGQFVV